MDRGAHFVKTDLQVHSPRDPNWKLKCSTDVERDQFAREFIAACRDAGLGAVAITDHHDFCFVPYIRAAAEAEVGPDGKHVPAERRVVVFPGLELTLEVPCQALLLFSSDFPGERLSAVLEKLGIEQGDPTNEKANNPRQLPFKTIQSLYDRLDETDWLRGQYIVLPNVTDKGHGTIMRKQMYAHYREMPCVGGYLDSPVAKIGTGNRDAFAGRDTARGNKRLAVIQTSDARTFEALGTNASWIKWAEPTAEALRQACLAEESRIAHSEPAVPSVFITKISVSNSKFLGPFVLEMNPQYNALIGGRGTGKSTCLEYLRWGLCDQPPPPGAGDDGPDLAARRKRLIDLTLEPVDGHVEVHFLLNQIPHFVRRYARSGEIQLKVGDRELAPATEDHVRSLLPIRAYSQRQLSDIGVRLDELIRFVTAPLKDNLADLASRRDAAAASIRENFVNLQRVRSLTGAIARDELAKKSLDQQTASIRASLTGLTEAHQAVLAEKPAHDSADALVASWNSRAEQATGALESAVAAVDLVLSGMQSAGPDPAALPEDETLLAIEREVREVLTTAHTSLRDINARLRKELEPDSALGKLNAIWAEKQLAFRERYEAAAMQSTTHATKLTELTSLEARSRELQQSLAAQTRQLEALGDPETRHQELRSTWLAVHAERTAVLETQCKELTVLSGDAIRATILKSAGASTQQQQFKALLQGSGVRTTKIEAFLKTITTADEPLLAWHQALDELEQIVITAGDSRSRDDVPSSLKAFTASDLERIAEKLTPEAILDLSLTPFEDHPVFQYRTKEGVHINFADASAGQQATALLTVLLSQPGPPLIIDQPEDDLDSQVIQGVVDLIWSAKHSRQLIFSSHNANLVVNGDAELIACFNYRSTGDQSSGEIELQGAIDTPRVRSQITTVMEGGEKAFRLRKEKYGF